MLKFLQAVRTRIFFRNSTSITGWLKKWIAPVSLLAITVISLTAGMPNRAAAQETGTRSGSISDQQQTSAASFQELLEYLGQWETDKGNWIDPSDLDWLLRPDQETGNDEDL